MHYQKGQSDFSPLAITTPSHKSHRPTDQGALSPSQTATPSDRITSRFDFFEDALSPQSSTCVRSTSSQDLLLTRSELIGMMHTISNFALHYAAVYHGIGCSYHSLPFSARRSEWVIEGMRVRTDDAFTASQYKQLPDLVYIFSEVSHRLDETQRLLHRPRGDWQASEKQLRRCDALLQEAELRLRFLQAGVGNMWFTVGRDGAVSWDEGDVLARARAAFENRWMSVLPQICFADHVESHVQNNASKEAPVWMQEDVVESLFKREMR